MTTATDDIASRLAVLEERTKPKPPNMLSNLKDYGGIAALVISLLYSFPLGLWDRFVVDGQKRESAVVSELRKSMLEIQQLQSRAGEVRANTRDLQALDTAIRGLSNQILLILTNNDAGYMKYRDRLTAEELVSVGLAYQNLYFFPQSMTYFQYAKEKTGTSELMEVEIDRQISKSYFMPSGLKDLKKGRESYRAILTKLSNVTDARLGQAITIQGEWGAMEMMMGDWSCGVENLDAAIARLGPVQQTFDPQGFFMATLQQTKAAQALKPGQSNNGCT